MPVFLMLGQFGRTQSDLRIGPENGLRIAVAEEHAHPLLRILLPGAAASDRTIEVLFPEHVTVRRHGHEDAEQLYLFRPGSGAERPVWKRAARSLEYERDFAGGIHLLARATLENNGICFEYEFTNHSKDQFDLVYAVTDPRMTSVFHDERLERTYVHHSDGFELLAIQTPERLTLPIAQWLPCRYLDAYTWPVPRVLAERRADGYMYYNKSRAVDFPFVATLSKDRRWVAASFTPQTDRVGNVWSNPELTCQHVDPQGTLQPGEAVTLQVNMLIFRGTLEEAFAMAQSYGVSGK